MKECGKTTFLEVVAYTEAEELEGAKMAADCGCEILMSTKEFPYAYRIVEEGHHFHKEENGEYYRISKIYRECILKATGEVVKKELKWNNHSKVMFDHALIPQEQIR